MSVAAPRPPLLAIGLVSAAAIAYELLLIRLFALVHWHHLVATAIALALLGYGVSGTLLAIWRRQLLNHLAPAIIINAALFAVAMPLSAGLAQRIGFDPLALAWDPSQWLALAGVFLVLALPFLAAANCIGLALTAFPASIPRLYGIDLLGAGIGATLLVATLTTVAPAAALSGVGLLACVAVVSAGTRLGRPRLAIGLALPLIPAVLLLRPDIHPAAYKDLAQAMQAIGAHAELERHGVTGTLTVVHNPQVPPRNAPGLSLLSADLPPTQRSVFIDGDLRGVISAFDESPTADRYLDQLTSALPYALLTRPRVIVLNAGTGIAVQQALRNGAVEVHAVEPDPLLTATGCTHYAGLASRLCDPKRVHWHGQSARSYVNSRPAPVDLIKMRVSADANGLDALSMDLDLTVEGLVGYLDLLDVGGLVALDLSTRVPPRLTRRLLASARAALDRRGALQPGAHIAAIRGWQRLSVIIAKAPLSAQQRAQVRAFSADRGFDLVWLSDLADVEINRFQRLREPLFNRAARAALADAATDDRFISDPATDERPFIHRATRWSELIDALGSGSGERMAQLDAGLTVAVGTLLLSALLSVLFILAPLRVLGRDPGAGAALRWRTFTYFTLIGLGFLFIEITWIHRLEPLLDHPLIAASVVLAAFLVGAGMGSLWAQRTSGAAGRRLLGVAAVGIVLLNLAWLALFPVLQSTLGPQPLALRMLTVTLLLLPLAFLMGMPFPVGLRALSGRAAGLVPWAWGINGCASVISATAVPLLAAEIGLGALILCGALGYVAIPALMPGADGPGRPRPGTHGADTSV